MIQAACSKCGASFNVEGKPAGASFKCPKCKAGHITVPAPAVEDSALEELTDAEEVPAEDIELIEVDEAAAPSSAPVPAPKTTPRPAGGARRPASGARAPRAARSASEGAPPAKSSGKKIGIIAGVAVAIGAGAWFATRGGSEPASPSSPPAQTDSTAKSSASGTNPINAGGANDNGAPATTAGGNAATSTPAKALSPREDIAAKRAALAPADVAGRLALADAAQKANLRTERTLLLRDVLLVDPDNETARAALGFTKYTGRATPYKGRWMDKEATALATRAEEWLDGTTSGGAPSSGGSTPSDSGSSGAPSSSGSDEFTSAAKALQDSMQGDYPNGEFDYRFDDGIMPRPYVAAIQRASGTSVDDLEKEFGKAFAGLYATFMGRYRDRFQLDELTEPVPVVLFGSAEHHDAFVLKRDPKSTYLAKNGIGGYFNPTDRKLTLYRQPHLMGVLFHEGTHQLVHFAVGPNFQSPWFQEGIAEFFGGHRIQQVPDANGRLVNRYELGQFISERYGYLQQQIPSNSAMTVKELVNFGYPQFSAAQHDPSQSSENSRKTLLVYAEGWALIMFLHYADGGAMKEKFDQYFEAEKDGESSGDKFGEIMGLESDSDWATFDKKFKDWVMNELPKMRS